MNLIEIQRIIDEYREWKRSNPDPWIQDCISADTLDLAVELAATARTQDGRKNPHQWRIPNAILDQFAVAILNRLNLVSSCSDFEHLISVISGCRVKGIGELAIYDAAHRIGSYLSIQPETVYLHSGTRTGAENLLNKVNGNSILISQLPQPFQDSNLTCADVEDILCHYADELLACVE